MDVVSLCDNDITVFYENVHLRNSACMCIMQIGAEIKNLPMEYRDVFTQVDWNGLTGQRDIVAHQYDHLDYSLVWATLVVDLPPLRDVCKLLIQSIKINGNPNLKPSSSKKRGILRFRKWRNRI